MRADAGGCIGVTWVEWLIRRCVWLLRRRPESVWKATRYAAAQQRAKGLLRSSSDGPSNGRQKFLIRESNRKTDMIEALDIHVTGIVQGVGFRPFVYRMAKKHLVTGWVLNATDGVYIHAEAEQKNLDAFVIALSEEAPAASRVKEIEMKEVPLEDFDSFEIRFSDDADVEATTLVSPDLATCADCEAELFDPENRRYRYPFINCTNCGPRFTIIQKLPYDRPLTSMGKFPMCEECEHEYKDPLDRRFHAQPDACFECGPHLNYAELSSNEELRALGVPTCDMHDITPDKVVKGLWWGMTRPESDELIARVQQVVYAGGVAAIKGLGGFHLACDARNEEAVVRLRVRKHRSGKALAVMVRTIEDARTFAQISPEEEALLTSAARPIVLLKKSDSYDLAPSVTGVLTEVGVMLPATPLQHLLLEESGSVWVMTSGNLHDEPIQTDDETARGALQGIADVILGHDRDILQRYDDSVVRVITPAGVEPFVQFIRRARGYAPLPLPLPESASKECLLAVGPQQKNTLTLTRPGEAFVSQHVGDMDHPATQDAWQQVRTTYERLFELKPNRIVCDVHPRYATSQWAERTSAEAHLPLERVQHHHAHIASVLGEHAIDRPVIGVAFDGTGAGMDHCVWGGEVLISNYQAFERFANVAYFPLPGAEVAIHDIDRVAYGLLWACDLLEHPAARTFIDQMGERAQVCDEMIEKNVNVVQTSSMGRLFDGVSALLGVCHTPTYEGEGAILLEACAWGAPGDVATVPAVDAAGVDSAAAGEAADSEAAVSASQTTSGTASADVLPNTVAYRMGLVKNTATAQSTAQDTSVVLLDPEPLVHAVLDDIKRGVPTAHIARAFHQGIAQAVIDIVRFANAAYEINDVVLSGGVFMNRMLLEACVSALSTAGFTCALNSNLPPNDACVSFGQAVVALHQVG